jgi:hypothetical protein
MGRGWRCSYGTGNLPYQNVWNSDAIRLARFELGIEITLDEDGDFGVVNLAPGSADPFGTRHASTCSTPGSPEAP